MRSMTSYQRKDESMSSKLKGIGRWCAICGLWFLVIVFAPLSWILRKLGSGGLFVAEWAKDRLEELS